MLVYSAASNSADVANSTHSPVANDAKVGANGVVGDADCAKPWADKDALRKQMTQWGLHQILQNLVIKFNDQFDAVMEEQQKRKVSSKIFLRVSIHPTAPYKMC